MTITCRVAKTADVPELAGLMGQLGYDVGDAEMHEVVRAVQQGHGQVFVADSGGRVVGCIDAIVDVRLAEGRVGEVASLVVSADYRGSGVGKILLRCAEDWLRSRVRVVRIRANTMRGDAHEFYEAAGYNAIKEQKVFIRNL